MTRPDARHGRGAPENRTPTRFNLPVREADGDWLDAREAVDDGPPSLRTTVTVEKPKTILARNSSPDVSFDRSINPYRGCEHGCIYCFARPTHAFHDLSPGLDFESKLFAKPTAAQLLRVELGKPGYRPAPIAMGTNTDPYQPIEAKWRIMREILEVLAETRHPVMITTKSDRILRDLDLLAPMGAQRLVGAALSITSLDPAVSRTLEPRAPSAKKRLAAVKALAAAGVPTSVAIAPVVPQVTDHELEAIVAAAAEAAAVGVRHPKWDERPLLLVVRKEGAEVTPEAIQEHLTLHVARWWLPDEILFVDSLPHTATGKLLKTAIRDQYRDYKLPTA